MLNGVDRCFLRILFLPVCATMHSRYETRKGLAHEGAPPTSSSKGVKGGTSEGMGTLLAPCYSINGNKRVRVDQRLHVTLYRNAFKLGKKSTKAFALLSCCGTVFFTDSRETVTCTNVALHAYMYEVPCQLSNIFSTFRPCAHVVFLTPM